MRGPLHGGSSWSAILGIVDSPLARSVGIAFPGNPSGVQSQQVKQLGQGENDHEGLHSFHSLAASVAGVDLLAGKTHGQQSERPRDYGSGGCGSQALSAPNANMVEPRQHGSETGHARNQDDGNEDGRHHVADGEIVGDALVGVQITVQDRTG